MTTTLDDIVSLNISIESASVTQAGFGTPLIFDYHTHWVDMVRTYTNTQGMLDDGFVIADAGYQAALKIFSQNPRVSQVKVGRKLNSTTWRMELTPTVANNAIYSGVLQLPGGIEETFSFTSDGTATLGEITAGMVAAINALSGAFTATDQTTHVRVQADVAGVKFILKSVTSNLAVRNGTLDVSAAADLAAVIAADDDWYGLISTSKGEAEILSLAASIEAVRKIFVVASQDSRILTNSALDIASQLFVLNYARTAIIYSGNEGAHPDAAWAGKCLPFDPGSETWKFKELAGIAADSLSSTQLGFVKGKAANYYITIAGQSITGEGKVAEGEFIDVIRFIDFIYARIQENVFAALASAVKVPFTDPGIAIVENEIRGVLQLGVTQGGFSRDPQFTVFVPRAADVSALDKANRLLPDITFTATLAGAIHAVEISGTVSV